MPSPILIFPLPANGMPAEGATLNPAKSNKGDRWYTLTAALGALGSCVAGTLSTFVNNFPAWGPFATAQLGSSAPGGGWGSPRMSLWTDPTSSSYILCLNSLLTSAGGLPPTSLEALAFDEAELDEDTQAERKAMKPAKPAKPIASPTTTPPPPEHHSKGLTHARKANRD